ncbi:MAG: thiamine diphosphokinase [Tannerellaceae bacterium]|jgi:thiamine pyrophosphokinase|nr:thiamine diphosphokinase [Tannerellaceae bacterium]
MIKPYNCVIVANGSFPSSPLPLQMLGEASVIIACDGAVEALHKHGFIPRAIVGDMDSLPVEMREIYADRLYVHADQETNDLTKAVCHACTSGQKEALIVGATGMREDHTLGNISLLADYASLFNRVEILTDYGLFTPLCQTTTLKSKPGQQVSLVSLYPEGKITTENLRWPVANRILTSWWQGTLNEALGDSFTIHLEKNARVIVYRLFAEK